MSNHNTKYSSELKAQVLERLKAGKKPMDVANEFSLTYATVLYFRQAAGMHTQRQKKDTNMFSKTLTPVMLEGELKTLCDGFVHEIKTLLLKQIYNNINV